MVAVARKRRACEARGRSGAALPRARHKRRRRPRLAGADPGARAHIAAWSGRRVGADLQWFCIGLRRASRWRHRSEAASRPGRPRRRDCGRSQQSGRRITPRADLLDLHQRLTRRRGVLIVDEAFADFDAGESLAPALPRAARSSCARSARLTGWPGCGSVSRSLRRTSSRPCGTRLGPGRSAARRSRSGFARLPIRIGSKPCARASATTPCASTPSCAAPTGGSSAERACFAWPRRRMRAPLLTGSWPPES